MKKIILAVLLFTMLGVTMGFDMIRLENAIDDVVKDRGRQNREQTLTWLHNGVKKSSILTSSQKERFLEVLIEDLEVYVGGEEERAYEADSLVTNTAIRSLGLEQILDGGPGKDGIPSLDDPLFMTPDQARREGYVTNISEGIALAKYDGSDAKFYPYSILNWHEIVNDEIGGDPVVVTYCPLCGTAITYDRTIDGEVFEFGVSGKLFQSNLLMYDKKTESLWSQAFGVGKVGVYTDYMLEYYPSQHITLKTFFENYPQGVVLSNQTGYRRNYVLASPYGDYDTSDDLYFPVDAFSDHLDPKTLMVVVNDKRGFSVAFDRKKLTEVGVASVRVDDAITVTAIVEDKGIVVVEDGHFVLPHFSEMRFSRSARNLESELWWSGDTQ